MCAKALVGIALLSTMIATSATACIMWPEEKAALFRDFDTNNDQKISEKEYIAGESKRLTITTDKLKQSFSDLDTQHKSYGSYRVLRSCAEMG